MNNEVKNKITILLTVHDLKVQEYDYWKNVEEVMHNNNLEIHILVDKSKTYDLLIEKGFNKENLFKFDESMGKFKKIVNHLNARMVKTEYIKICDPDDYMDLDKFLDIKLDFDDSIIITSSYKDFSGKIMTSQNEVNELLPQLKIWFQKSFGTPSTILPTSYLVNPVITVHPGELDYTLGDDLLLAEIAFVNGAEIKFREDICFYIYSFKDGVSSPENMVKRLDDVDFVKKSIISLRRTSGRSSNIRTISEMLKLSDLRATSKKQFKGSPETIEKFKEILSDLTSIGL